MKVSSCHKKGLHKQIILLLSIICLLSDISITNPARMKSSSLVLNSILKWPDDGTSYAVLVDKLNQKVYIYHKLNPFRPYRVYRCSTGENRGAKRRKNDRRTPEGLYFFTDSFEKKELAPIYGDRAFPIDYPNQFDRKEGRDGYGIWFHGLNRPMKPMDTNGCIALENRNINELANIIKLRRTPVIISYRIKMIPYRTLQRQALEIEQLIEEWRSSWEGKNIDRYISYYSPGFTNRGMNLEKWKQYKSRLARRYRRIKVDIKNLGIYRYNDTIVAIFFQSYFSSALRSEGIKRLYLRRNSEQWRIAGEFFKEEKIEMIPRLRPYVSKLKEIEKFIRQWKEAWQEKAIRSYISCYDRSFRFKGMNLKEWERYKKRLMRRYRKINIVISYLHFREQIGGAVKVRFRQDFTGDLYHDSGIKEMTIIKRGKSWKILREEWRPIR